MEIYEQMQVTTCPSMIVPSIDWFQGVFNNVDFDFIFHEFLGLGFIPYEDPEIMHSMEIKMGYDEQCGFNYNGIIVTTSKSKFLSAQGDGFDVFRYIFESIQFKITGEGMRYLRSVDPDIEYTLHRNQSIDFNNGAGSFHITRADFAFDLVNYDVDFLSDLISHLHEITCNGGRAVPVLSAQKPKKFEVHSGSQSTVYIGANRSNTRLRVYDKLLESKGDLSKLPIELPSGSVVDTWQRIELQTRNEYAFFVFYGTDDWTKRFRYVHDEFAFCDENREECEFWAVLFDWGKIGSIIQNAKWAEPVLTRSKIEKGLDRALKQILPFLYSAPCHWEKWLHDEIRRVEKELNTPGYEKSYAAYLIKMKTAILADFPVDDEGKVLLSESLIRSQFNITLIPHKGYNHWYLSH